MTRWKYHGVFGDIRCIEKWKVAQVCEMTRSPRIWDISVLFRWGSFWPRLRGGAQASITVWLELKIQIWPRIAEIIKHSGYRRLDYWVIIGKFCHLSGEKLSLSSSRILNSIGTAGMEIRLGRRKQDQKELKLKLQFCKEHNENLSAPDAYLWSRWWWNQKP